MNSKVILIMLASSFALTLSEQHPAYCKKKLSKLTDCDGNEVTVFNVSLLARKTKGHKGEPGHKGSDGRAGLRGLKGVKGEKGSCKVEDIDYLMREVDTIKYILNHLGKKRQNLEQDDTTKIEDLANVTKSVTNTQAMNCDTDSKYINNITVTKNVIKLPNNNTGIIKELEIKYLVHGDSRKVQNKTFKNKEILPELEIPEIQQTDNYTVILTVYTANCDEPSEFKYLVYN